MAESVGESGLCKMDLEHTLGVVGIVATVLNLLVVVFVYVFTPVWTANTQTWDGLTKKLTGLDPVLKWWKYKHRKWFRSVYRQRRCGLSEFMFISYIAIGGKANKLDSTLFILCSFLSNCLAKIALFESVWHLRYTNDPSRKHLSKQFNISPGSCSIQQKLKKIN